MNAMTKNNGEAVPTNLDETEKTSAPKRKRRWGRILLMIVLPAALAIGGAWFWVTGGRYQETENAYLQQAKVTIAAETAGRVVESQVADNAHVEKGDVLFTVDPAPYRIALEQADATLAAARMNVEQLRASYKSAQAQARAAASEVAYLEAELQRQSDLSAKGIASDASLDTARRDLQKAKDAQAAAEQSVAGALAALGGDADIETDSHPTVQAALAARDKAAYELEHTVVHAPADGVIAQASSFRTGRFVTAGEPLFSLVETQDGWIEANFKETQLTHMRRGQTAEVVLDTWPDHPFEAKVEAIGAGTGAEFSLLPAQNATGNWVKVTQRVPVRLSIEGLEADLPLRTGMSATVTVDTEQTRGLPDVAGLFGTAVAAE